MEAGESSGSAVSGGVGGRGYSRRRTVERERERMKHQIVTTMAVSEIPAPELEAAQPQTEWVHY